MKIRYNQKRESCSIMPTSYNTKTFLSESNVSGPCHIRRVQKSLSLSLALSLSHSFCVCLRVLVLVELWLAVACTCMFGYNVKPIVYAPKKCLRISPLYIGWKSVDSTTPLCKLKRFVVTCATVIRRRVVLLPSTSPSSSSSSSQPPSSSAITKATAACVENDVTFCLECVVL